MILDDILERKRADLPERKRRVPLTELEGQAGQWERRDFVQSVSRADDEMRVIAELKKATPSRGLLCEDYRPVELGRAYAAGGAAAISVLTDGPFFQGKDEHLTALRDVVSIPLLRKDFLIDPYQVVEAAAIGADAVLLIVAVLEDAQLTELQAAAHEQGLQTLVEVNTEDELDRALALDLDVLGINNRDLHTFTVTLDTTVRLAPRVPAGVPVASLSGVFTAADVAVVHAAGASAVLVGEALMRAPNVGALLEELRRGAREDLRHHATG